MINSTRTAGDVRMRLFLGTERPAPAPTAAGSPSTSAAAASAPSARLSDQPGTGSVDFDAHKSATPTAKAVPPAIMPAVGTMAAARAMEIDGLKMNAMSSSTLS